MHCIRAWRRRQSTKPPGRTLALFRFCASRCWDDAQGGWLEGKIDIVICLVKIALDRRVYILSYYYGTRHGMIYCSKTAHSPELLDRKFILSDGTWPAKISQTLRQN